MSIGRRSAMNVESKNDLADYDAPDNGQQFFSPQDGGQNNYHPKFNSTISNHLAKSKSPIHVRNNDYSNNEKHNKLIFNIAKKIHGKFRKSHDCPVDLGF